MTECTQTNAPTATRVPDHERSVFIPKLLPGVPLIIAENQIFGWMSRLCADYGGGFWDYFETSNGGRYIAPTGYGRMRIECEGNMFSGEMSEDAAGIVATLFALSHLSFRFSSDALSEQFAHLREYSFSHPESELISRAID